MTYTWWGELLWVLAAGGLGFLVAAVFAGWLKLPRRWFLLPYTILGGAFLATYVRWSGVDLIAVFRHNWMWGMLGAIIIGAFMAKNVFSQPASPTAEGADMTVSLAWQGIVYGLLDGLLLSAMPVFATWQAFAGLGWTGAWYGQVAAGAAALLASILVTAAYHLGYPEFQGREVMKPILGCGIISVAYLITQNPIATVASHAVMHVAAVLRGPATTVQLPPHYERPGLNA